MKILSRLLLILLTTSTYAQIAGSAMTLHFNSTNHVPGAGVIDCGGTRLHDADSWAWWVVQSRGPTSFNWGGLDTFLADVYTACGGAVPTIYQLGGSPSWAPSVSNPAPACAQDMNGVNGCYPPSDLNADGTGTNLIWRNWVAAAGTHLNAAGYTSNHAHVQYLEPWNEVDNSCILNPVINDGRCASNFWEGTYAQLMRMTQDLRCIWEGDTSMTVGATGETCAQVRSKVTSVRLSGPIDPTALILVPSSHLTYGSYGNGSTNVSQNLLYCNNSPKAGSQCTNGGMHAAVDILNEHIKPCNTTCDLTSNFVENNITTNVSNWKSFLQTAELAKPLWITEGGFSG